MTFSTLVYTNCLAYAKANSIDVVDILVLSDIVRWDSDLTIDRDSEIICDGHIEFIELCCKNSGLI